VNITIAIPCFNSMKYLDKCISSALSQDYGDYVVWAYDNESTDGTYEYLLELEKKHDNLKVFQLPNIYPNGYGEAQEHIAENCKTDYVTFVGSDDYLESDYITKCMKVLAHKPGKIKCMQSGLTGVLGNQLLKEQVHTYKSLEEFKKECLIRSPVNTPTVIFHKSILQHIRLHEAHTSAGHTCIGAGDYDTYCYLADKEIFIYPVPVCLGYYYRWHDDQCTWKVREDKKEIDYDKTIQDYWRKKWNM
jgi:glycosyltransferase involved in cell wall biosynthesis